MKINPSEGNNNLSLPSQDDFSSFFASLDDNTLSFESFLPTMPPRKKRKAEEKPPDHGRVKTNITHLVSSLLMMDEEERSHQSEMDRAEEFEKSVLDSTHDLKTQAMLQYYSQFQDQFADTLAETNRFRAKRGRMAAVAAATAAAAAAAAAEEGEVALQNQNQNQNQNQHQQQHQHQQQQQQRRLWVKDRSRAWWDRCNQPDFPDSEFRRAFRMGRATFDMICDDLTEIVAKEDTMLRAAIPVRQRVAVCIWRLATGEPLRLVSKRFGLGISTCHKLVLEVCSAIKTRLMPKFLQWPDTEGIAQTKQTFESLSGIPNVVGSMYTTHVPIIAPKISVAAYFNKRHTERNQKTSYSITVQGVVNPKGVFTDVCIGWPGSMPDDQILEKSALYQRAEGGLLNGMWIVGSAGYPLMDWVLVPYSHQHLTWTQHAFNEKIGEIQKVAKDAFARLKGRWSCLQKRTEVKLQDLPVVLGACCVLHNICEIRGEEMDPELNYELVDDEMVPESGLRSMSSMQARDNIAHNLLHHGLAGTTFV